MARFLLAAASFGLLFIIVELISRKNRHISADDSRKIVHIVSGLLVARLPALLSFHAIALLGLFFVGFMIISRRLQLFPSIHGVERRTLGELYYPLSIALTAWLFPNPVVFVYGVLSMAVADGFASVIGMRYGRHPYTLFGARKTHEGSATFWTISLVLSMCTLAITSTNLAIILVGSVALASILTLVEASLKNGLDNLLIPVIAAEALTILL